MTFHLCITFRWLELFDCKAEIVVMLRSNTQRSTSYEGARPFRHLGLCDAPSQYGPGWYSHRGLWSSFSKSPISIHLCYSVLDNVRLISLNLDSALNVTLSGFNCSILKYFKRSKWCPIFLSQLEYLFL